MYIYIDETGNTGKRIDDNKQPVMGIGGIITTKRVAGGIVEQHRLMLEVSMQGKKELKGGELPRSRKKRVKIEEIAKNLEEECGPISMIGAFGRKDHRVYAGIADDLVMNPWLSDRTVRWYQETGRFDLAELGHRYCKASTVRMAWQEGLRSKSGMLEMRRGVREKIIKEILGGAEEGTEERRVLIEAWEKTNEIADGPRAGIAKTGEDELIRSNGPDEICMSLLWGLIEGRIRMMGKGIRDIEEIVFDESDPRNQATRLEMLECHQMDMVTRELGIPRSVSRRMSDNDMAKIRLLAEERIRWINRIVRFADSIDETGIQWADVLISIVRKHIEGGVVGEWQERLWTSLTKRGCTWTDFYSREISRKRGMDAIRAEFDYRPTGERRTIDDLRGVLTDAREEERAKKRA